MKHNEWYVYIIHFWGIDLIKIWKSTRPLERIIELLKENNQTEIKYLTWFSDNKTDYNKYSLNIIDIVKTNNYNQLEKDLHNYFKESKVDYKKEYFNIDYNLLKNIDYSKIWEWYNIEKSFISYRWEIEIYDFELLKSLDVILKRRELLKSINWFNFKS